MANKIKLSYYIADTAVDEFEFSRGASEGSSVSIEFTKKVNESASRLPLTARTSAKRFVLVYKLSFSLAPIADFNLFMTHINRAYNKGDETLMRLTDWNGIKSSGYITSSNVQQSAIQFGKYIDFSFEFTTVDYDI